MRGFSNHPLTGVIQRSQKRISKRETEKENEGKDLRVFRLVVVQGFGRPVALSGRQLEIQSFHLLPYDADLFLI